MIDFHNHVIPGVDDGAVDDAESVSALGAMRNQGIDHVVATPHVDGSLTERPEALARRLEQLDAGWQRLLATAPFPDMVLMRGAEVMLDTPTPDVADGRLRLAGTQFVLVEFPFMMVPPLSSAVIRKLAADGYTAIIAHPERYAGMTPESPLPAEWRAAGALLQVNAGSITGKYGPAAKRCAWALLGQGLASFVCSDYHARGEPATKAAVTLLGEAGGTEQAEMLCTVNARRLLAGESALPVAPVRPRHGLWHRLRTGWSS